MSRYKDEKLNYGKVILISIVAIVIVILTVFGIKLMIDNKVETTEVAATKKELGQEASPIQVKEEIILVAKDTKVDESLTDQKEVSNGKIKVVVPKSTVAPAKSAEDSESSKKKGGSAVSQEQAQSMFESVGKKSMGIDVSSHQGKINWAQVKASGVDFAIIRCGFRGQTYGSIYEDAYFKSNVAGAIANGVKVGIYFYSTAVNENEALEEAAWVVQKISTYPITYPVVYDFEDFGAYRCSGVGGAQATSNALTFLNFVRSNGYEPMMYANKSDITNRLSRGSFNCKFWLAHYTSQTDYAGSYQMWQYTSKGSVPGISGNVDMDVAYFAYGTSAAAKHSHEFNELVKNSEKAATCAKDGSKVMRCSCGETQTETLKATGHTWGKWETKKEATSTEKGLKERTCSICKEVEKADIPVLSTNTNTNSNTNTNTNTNSNVNNNANTNNNTVDKPIVHEKHDFKEVSRTDATCTKNGSIELKCSCGETKTETINATGHRFGDWNQIKAPSEEADGEKIRTCSVCKEVEKDTIPKLEKKQEDSKITDTGEV